MRVGETTSSLRADVVFWGLLGLFVGMLLAPLWMGAIPPTTDFGGHAQVVHGYARLGDGAGGAWPNVWLDIIERRETWWLPNLLVVRLAAMLHPALDAIAALRLWSSVALVLTVVGHVYCLATFGRSRWLVFLALPVLMWNGFVGLGFINYYFGLACLPWAIALARRIATDDVVAKRHLVLLALVGVACFFLHAFAAFLLLMSVTLVLVTSVVDWRRVLAGLALLPAAGLWYHWFKATRGELEPRELHFELPQKLEAIVRESIELLPGTTEEHVLVVLLLAMLFTFASGILWEPVASPAPSRAAGQPWRALRASTLWLLFAALVAVYFGLPSYLDDMPTAERTIPWMVAVMFMLPRARPEAWMTRAALGAAAAAAIVLAVTVGNAVREFEDVELAPMMTLMRRIPPGVRAQCVDVQFARPVFLRRPVDHGCDGLLAVDNDAFAGGGFADTTHAAVFIKPGRPEKRLLDRRWGKADDLPHVEWLLARGPHAAPAPELAEAVAWIEDEATKQRTWTLYRSLLAGQPPPAFEDLRGGPGGTLAALDCPPGHALSAVPVSLTRDKSGLVQSVGAECSRVQPPGLRGDIATLETRRVRLSAMSNPGVSRRTLTCSGRRPIVGLSMRTGLFVDAVALACAPTRASALWGDVLAAPLGEVGTTWGGPGGNPTEVRCPRGMIATGLRVRAGKNVDALGVACRPLAEVLGAGAGRL
ncbi:MAG: hypothetical protein IT385_18590 [Deltaproteobacteria bacterium]|nr:hypothetical protein [Deltaproteobacteria bacterium]